MKYRPSAVLLALLWTLSDAAAASAKASPLPKVIQLITDLQAKTLKEGEAEQKTYDKFVTWCQLTSQEKQQTIKTSTGKKNSLEAAIEKASSKIEELGGRIQALSGSLATDEADLKAGTAVRKKRRTDFESADKELSDIISTLERAQSVLEKELAKIHASGASFLDKTNAGQKDVDEMAILREALGADSADRITALAQSFSTLVDAAGLLSAGPLTGDMSRFQILLQMQDTSTDEDAEADIDGESDGSDELGAPSAAAYKTVSGGIVKTLASTQEKAEASQDELRKKEAAEQHEFDLLKQSLTDKMDTESKELDNAKKSLAAASEKKAAAEGNLELTNKELSSTQASLQNMQHDCMSRANDFEAGMKERQEELTALAKAKKVIQDVTTTAAVQIGSPSFLQIDRSSAVASRRSGVGMKVMQRLRTLSAETKSAVLAQVTTRLHSILAESEHMGADPFQKVSKLIKDMIQKLTQEAQEEQNQKEFCDREMAHTESNKEEKESRVEDLTTRMEINVAQGLKLKEEITQLTAEMSDIKKSQAEMDTIRAEEHAEFTSVTADLKESISAVQAALGILRDYYSQDSGESLVQTDMRESMKAVAAGPSDGAAKGIIALLEVAEADFSKNLAQAEATEQAAVDEYNKITQDNKATLAVKATELKNKEQQAITLQKTYSELTADRAEVQTELDAVLEYYEKLKPQCIAKPESYEERMARREKEIDGLKEAIVILGEEATA